MLEVVQKHGAILTEVYGRYRDDKEIIYAAVRNCPRMMAIVDTSILSKDLVLTAVDQKGSSLEYVPDKLKTDPDIIFTALKHGFSSLDHTPDEYRTSPLLIRKVLGVNGLCICKLNNSFKSNKEMAWIALKQNPMAYQLISKDLQADEEILRYMYNVYGISDKIN